MPFRVELALETKDAKSLWTKAIHCYLGVSDSFKITFRHDNLSSKGKSEVTFSVINKTRTTLMTTRFYDEFFKLFKVDGQLSMPPAINDKENNAPAFSIWVNTKEMDVLFKDCGEDAESWTMVLICGDELVQQVYSNKMFVEFKTKSDIIKKYSVNYQQGYPSFDTEFRHLYYETLQKQNQNLDTENMARVHRLAMNPIILKNFLNMFPTALEDFKIQVYPNIGTVHLLGFNRHDLVSTTNHKDKPMNLKIVIKLEDIIFNNVLANEKQPADYTLSVSFKLRDFKSFVNLISSDLNKFVDASNINSSSAHRRIAGFNSFNKPVIDITFSISGDPVVFERCYFLDRENEMSECCRVDLIEVTDSEGDKLLFNNEKEPMNVSMKQINSNIPSFTVSSDLQNQYGENIDHHEPLFVPSQTDATQVNNELLAIDANNRGIKRSLLDLEDNKDNRETEQEEEQEIDQIEYLGPTQQTSAVKGIFD